MPNPHLLTTSEAAGRLAVSSRTVARWAASGRLSVAQKLPGGTGAFLFLESDVAALREELLARFAS